MVDQIQIRRVIQADLPLLFEHQREPEANEMAAFPARDREAFMAHWTKILANEAVSAMAIILDGAVAGNILCWEQDDQRLLGYWVGKEYWGRGVATRALTQYLRIVTDRPIVAYVAQRNAGSIRVLEKCGFVLRRQTTEASENPADGVAEFVYVLQ